MHLAISYEDVYHYIKRVREKLILFSLPRHMQEGTSMRICTINVRVRTMQEEEKFKGNNKHAITS